MPDKTTLKRVARDRRQGKAPSTQAGEFVREEIEHIRAGKHGVRSAKQAICYRPVESAPRRRRAASAEETGELVRDPTQGAPGQCRRASSAQTIAHTFARDHARAATRVAHTGIARSIVDPGPQRSAQAQRC